MQLSLHRPMTVKPCCRPRGSTRCVRAAFTHGQQEVQQLPSQMHKLDSVQQSNRELGPYLLWDKALKLRAVWDSRAHNQADISAVVELLEGYAVDTITLDSTQGSRGQQLTTLTLVCKAGDSDQVAAALLQMTPTTHVSATECEQCYLPMHTVAVSTPHGKVGMHLSLAGSRVCKATPNWQHCEQAAAAAAAAAQGANGGRKGEGGMIDAAAVAAAAVEGLRAGLADGSIELGTQYLF